MDEKSSLQNEEKIMKLNSKFSSIVNTVSSQFELLFLSDPVTHGLLRTNRFK